MNDAALTASSLSFKSRDFHISSGVSSGKEFWRAYANEPGDGYIAPVASADIDADGETEVIIATLGSIYVYNGTTGKTETRFAFKGGKSGRNYGKLNILNLDDDDFLEIVMLADNLDEHISVNERIRSSTCDADMINEVDVYQTMEGEELK